MRSKTRAGFAGLTVGVVSVLLAGTATAAPAPGSIGVGDPYYPHAGNGGYDVGHYDLRLSYQPATDLLSGTTTILLTATQDLSRFNLDFGLKVSSVRVNNRLAQFATSTDGTSELTVTPASPLKKGQTAVVVVSYADTPSKVQIDGFTAWKKTPDGALAVDEPHIAAWWFPSNDHPTDLATYDVSVEVPNDVVALSNGTLVRKTQQRPGWTRWNWRSTKPQATYLTSLEVGKFEVHEQTTPDGQPFITAYGADLGESLDAAKASIERTPEITEFLASKFGPYPFEAQGGVATTGITFALENQTRPVYSARAFRSGSNTSIVTHEQAHQWFGNNVTLGKWSDIWLNEGFASYAEFLWSEETGEGTADELAQYLYDSVPADDPFWQVVVSDPGAERQFDAAVYDRGALAVHVLRKAVGDDTFFRILQTWQQVKKSKSAVIGEFVALAEQISGKQLDELFQTWLHTKGKPEIGPNGAAARAFTSETVPVAPKSYAKIKATHELLGEGHAH